MSLFESVIKILSETGKLPQKNKPHKLSGNYNGLWECHIGSDWLLVWRQDDESMSLMLIDIGTHSDIFS